MDIGTFIIFIFLEIMIVKSLINLQPASSDITFFHFFGMIITYFVARKIWSTNNKRLLEMREVLEGSNKNDE